MGLIFYDGVPLFVDGSLAMNEDCCCDGEPGVCSFSPCADSLTLNVSGGQLLVCRTYSGFSGALISTTTHSWNNLNGSYFTTDINNLGNLVRGAFSVGTYGSASDRGILYETSISSTGYLVERYVYSIGVGIVCSTLPDPPFTPVVCASGCAIGLSAGLLQVQRQQYDNGVFRASGFGVVTNTPACIFTPSDGNYDAGSCTEVPEESLQSCGILASVGYSGNGDAVPCQTVPFETPIPNLPRTVDGMIEVIAN